MLLSTLLLAGHAAAVLVIPDISPNVDDIVSNVNDKLSNFGDKLPNLDDKSSRVKIILSDLDDKVPSPDEISSSLHDIFSTVDDILSDLDNKLPNLNDVLSNLNDKVSNLVAKLPVNGEEVPKSDEIFKALPFSPGPKPEMMAYQLSPIVQDISFPCDYCPPDMPNLDFHFEVRLSDGFSRGYNIALNGRELISLDEMVENLDRPFVTISTDETPELHEILSWGYETQSQVVIEDEAQKMRVIELRVILSGVNAAGHGHPDRRPVVTVHLVQLLTGELYIVRLTAGETGPFSLPPDLYRVNELDKDRYPDPHRHHPHHEHHHGHHAHHKHHGSCLGRWFHWLRGEALFFFVPFFIGFPLTFFGLRWVFGDPKNIKEDDVVIAEEGSFEKEHLLTEEDEEEHESDLPPYDEK